MISESNVKKALQLDDSYVINGIEEHQNKDYEGFRFKIDTIRYRSRLAKKTPKKKGYFVAFYEKDSKSVNQAYSYQDSVDYTLVNIVDDDLRGIFIFPREVLKHQGILNTETQRGKMAIRVYPSWEKDLNSTATRTQNWQVKYFIDLS